jgi:hypothetical protein
LFDEQSPPSLPYTQHPFAVPINFHVLQPTSTNDYAVFPTNMFYLDFNPSNYPTTYLTVGALVSVRLPHQNAGPFLRGAVIRCIGHELWPHLLSFPSILMFTIFLLPTSLFPPNRISPLSTEIMSLPTFHVALTAAYCLNATIDNVSLRCPYFPTNCSLCITCGSVVVP